MTEFEPLTVNQYVAIAMELSGAMRTYDPFVNNVQVPAWNAVRSVAEKLVVLFENDPDFHPELFIGIVMNGKAVPAHE